MMRATSIVVFGLIAVLAGCSTSPAEPAPGPTATSAGPATVVRTIGPDPGDVVPAKLFVRPPLDVARRFVQVSTPLSPLEKLGGDRAPQESEHTDILRIAPKGVAGVYPVPIDTTQGEPYLFLGPQVEGQDAIQSALRDIVVLDPNGVQVNARAPKAGADNLLAMSAIPLNGHPVGTYTVKFKSGAPQTGLAIEARLASSNIVMKLAPSTLEHLLGNEDYVDATLLEGGVPITGAHVTADLVSGETLAEVAPVAFQEIGNGVYRAIVPPALGESSAAGAYLADVRAEGTAPSGTTFFRHGRTGFHFAIPTAKIEGISSQRVLTDDSGMITGFEVDVNLQSTSLDRLEISAKLTAVGADGQEHPIAIAHTGSAFEPGAHTVTLHFDAGHVRLTRAQGDFYVRDLQVFSLGTNSLFHRELAARNRVVFQNVARSSLRPLAKLTPSQQKMVEAGVFSAD